MSEFTKFIANLNRNRYTRLFHRIKNEKIPCAFFIPEVTFQEQISVFEQLKNLGFNVQYFFTLDENLKNPVLEVPVMHVKKIHEIAPKPKYVIATSSNSDFFVNRFKDAGMEIFNIFAGNENTNEIFDFYMDHLNEIEEVDSLLDEDSRQVFRGYISAKVSNRFTDFIFDPMPQYLLHGYLPKPNDIVICAGACDGATAAMFVDLKCRVIAFEMDQYNYELSKKLAAEKNFVLENFGLGSYEHEINYAHFPDNLGASRFVQAGRIVQAGGFKTAEVGNVLKAKIISIDQYVREKNLESVDFIQLDTEGAELEILKGAVVTMSRFKPTLAVSAYHKPEDIFTLAQFIKSIRSDYKFAFRHYGTEPASTIFANAQYIQNFLKENDLPMIMYSDCENVLYAR